MSTARRAWSLTVGLALGLAAANLGSASAAPAVGVRSVAVSSGAQTTSAVIVLLRDQHTNLSIRAGRQSARAAANLSEQSPLVAQAKRAGGRNVHSFSSINAFSATVTPAEAAALTSDPSVAAVVPDRMLTLGTPAKQAIEKSATATAAVPDSSVCPSDPNKPLLEPEALQVTNTAFAATTTPQAQNIVDGTGTKVAFIADGIDVNNPDLIRANGSHVLVDYQDFTGEGPQAPSGAAEAFGDASAIAAQGRQVYDLASYVNAAHPLPTGCTITVRGVAPGASMIGLKVFGNANTAPTSRFVQAIDYAISSNVDVLNESFGSNPYPDNNTDPISLADAAALSAGITVTVSTGDAGTAGTIGSPASLAGVISVGATTTFRSYAQTGASGFHLGNGTWADNQISALSSGGVTQQGRVPDLVAPGDLGWALCSTNTSVYQECTNAAGAASAIQDFGGTSQSAPLVAGAAALVIEAYENTHHGVRPTPALVKQLLTSTATDGGHPAFEQGSGLLNSLAAVQAAESWHSSDGSPAPIGTSLVASPTQLVASGNPGTTATQTLSVTNVSNHTQVVSASLRALGNTISSASGTDTLNTATAPTYVDTYGTTRSYVAQTFTVAANVNQLDVSTAAPLPNGSFLRGVLIDPSGAFTASSIPQGYSNYSHLDVSAPMAGTWTLYSAASKSSGYNGPVRYNVTQTAFTAPGSVSPASLTIKAGKTGKFTVSQTFASSPGDASESVQLTGGVTVSVPLTLRTDVPAQNTTWSGAITGGNGRTAPAQSNVYYLNVPAKTAEISAGFTFTDPGQSYFAVLRSPDGQVASYQSNVIQDGSGNFVRSNAMQLYRRLPAAGIWVLSLETANPVSGSQLGSSFTAKVSYASPSATATFPNSKKQKLAAGVPVNVPVTITNSGASTLTYFADGRLTTSGTIPLTEQSGHATTALPVAAGIYPQWLVPSEVTSLTAQAVANQPVNLTMSYESGEPSYYAAANGTSASETFSAAALSAGLWYADIGESGPFTGPAPSGTVTTSLTAKGLLFDPAITSTTGDLWHAGVASGNAVRAGAPAATPPAQTGPVTLAPGQSATITVTITPTASSGSLVSGTVFIDDFTNYLDSGDEVVAFPYSYTVK